jgi:hypothetical protein
MQFSVVAAENVSGFCIHDPKRAVEVVVPLPSPQQFFGLEPLEVRQVAESGKAERLQEFPRRHIGEERAGLRRADRAVDQALAFQRSDDVAADLPRRQPRNLPRVTGCS